MKRFLFLLLSFLIFACAPPQSETMTNSDCVADFSAVNVSGVCLQTDFGLISYTALIRPQDVLRIPCDFQNYKWIGFFKLFLGSDGYDQTFFVSSPANIEKGLATVFVMASNGDEAFSFWGHDGTITTIENEGRITVFMTDIIMKEATTGAEFIMQGTHYGCN